MRPFSKAAIGTTTANAITPTTRAYLGFCTPAEAVFDDCVNK
jgi:hypothetical protein